MIFQTHGGLRQMFQSNQNERSSITYGDFLKSNIYGLTPTEHTISMATGTSYTGTLSQADGGSISPRVQG